MEIGAVRVYVRSVVEAQALLEPLLQVTSRKRMAHLLGVSTRTLRRWSDSGQFPQLEGHVMADVVRKLTTVPASGFPPL